MGTADGVLADRLSSSCYRTETHRIPCYNPSFVSNDPLIMSKRRMIQTRASVSYPYFVSPDGESQVGLCVSFLIFLYREGGFVNVSVHGRHGNAFLSWGWRET